MSIPVDYTDERGIKRRVLVPDYTVPPQEGIPLSLRLDEACEGFSDALLARLVDQLWAVGLIEPKDFQPGTLRQMQSALMATIQVDVFKLLELAKEQSNGT